MVALALAVLWMSAHGRLKIFFTKMFLTPPAVAIAPPLITSPPSLDASQRSEHPLTPKHALPPVSKKAKPGKHRNEIEAAKSPPTVTELPPPVVNNIAPGGFATSGGILVNPRVYNFKDPPPAARVISDNGATSAVATLKAVSGSTLNFMIIGETGDITAFSNGVGGIFTSGGWQILAVHHTSQLENSSLTPAGFVTDHGEGIRCASAKWDEPAVTAARKALDQIGYPCKQDSAIMNEFLFRPRAKDSDFYISIGAPEVSPSH